MSTFGIAYARLEQRRDAEDLALAGQEDEDRAASPRASARSVDARDLVLDPRGGSRPT